ncbi:MAG: site-specific DNA-methyltransferase [Candidatus Omnitrophota bacterium]
MKKQKLELTWIGKDEEPRLEPRILIEDPDKSYGAKDTQNMLIHGDNLLALKALEQNFAGKIKCIYIDPPYNTGNAFEHYDDGLEHSLWLSLMKPRLELFRSLLSSDGSLWVTLDDSEFAYCKVLLDEGFGRNNFKGTIVWQHSVQGKGYEGKLSVHHNYIMVYQKSDNFKVGLLKRTEEHNKNYSNPDDDPNGLWRSGDVRNSLYRPNLIYDIHTPSGKVIKPPEKGWRWSKETVQEKIKTGEIIFSEDEERIIRKIYLSNQKGRVPETLWFGKEVGTTREANVHIKNMFTNDIFGTPKPERLIERVLELASDENDFVLDSFLGSGTTAAVAHKMGRRWIGVELGDHCYTHCVPRLKKVCDGMDQGGISKAVDWKGGGGFKFYELAPSLLKKDKYDNWIIDEQYNADMLASAMAKHEGFKYSPSEDLYWKQGQSTEKDFIFTATQMVTAALLDRIAEEMKPDESLLICCKSYQKACDNKYTNISIKKIPNMLLGRCEFGKEDYCLNIIDMPHDDDEPDFIPVGPEGEKKLKKKKKKDDNQGTFF